MVLTPSTMLSLGTKAPDFQLPDFEGKIISRDDFRNSPALLVMFICNHCPFVIHIQSALAELGTAYMAQGVGVVAINSNDVENYPEDSPRKMAEAANQLGYPFPYLLDETQEVAKLYQAACTPDFFLFDGEQRLVYRGQLDGSRPGNGIPVTGSDLSAAIDAVLNNRPVPAVQIPSIGCNIKWKPGNAPTYFG